VRFFLGTHRPGWLKVTSVPLFVSRTTLRLDRKLARPPRALGPWALDSGGFTELHRHGGWMLTPRQYASEVRRARDEIGNLQWAAPQDWMCEESALSKTGKTVAEHQRLTVENYLELTSIDPTLPIVPVLQGWTRDDYLRHADDYDKSGVDLSRQETVGVGSVCRRQAHSEAAGIMASLSRHVPGIRLHGFGFKTLGLRRCGQLLSSADSLAWSYSARKSPPLDGCTHRSCVNCFLYAMRWRQSMIDALKDRQGDLFLSHAWAQ
jgi:hypothetical protein